MGIRCWVQKHVTPSSPLDRKMVATVVVLSASGNAGFSLVREALARGHHVVAVARDVSKIASGDKLAALRGTGKIENLKFVEANLESSDLTPIVAGADAVISGMPPPRPPRRLINLF